jgi:hypothetical protein
MFSFPRECPVCSTRVTDWSTRCAKCRYHPDCDRRPYNRAQDDVAMVARYRRPTRAASHDTVATGGAWRRLVWTWLRRPGLA